MVPVDFGVFEEGAFRKFALEFIPVDEEIVDAVLGRSLDVRQVSRIFKKMARQAGFDKEVVDCLSAHSARIGATQDMIASDFGLVAVMQAGRWKTASMVLRYGERLLVQRGGAARFARLKAKPHASC